MFCPEGYVSLHEIEYESYLVGIDWLQKAGLVTDDQSYTENHFIRAASLWVILVFINRFHRNFLVTSLDGRLMRISNLAYHGPGHASVALDVELPFKTSDECRRFCADSGNYFPLFNEQTGVIRKPTNCEWIEIPELELSILAKFEGWAICWKPTVFSNWRSEFREILATKPQAVPKIYGSLATERRASQQIISMYDENDQVTKAACRERIGQSLGTLAFNRAWDTAKAERPGLGVGGRPKSKPHT